MPFCSCRPPCPTIFTASLNASTCKEISPVAREKKEVKIVRNKKGNFEASKELKRNSRNELKMIVLASEIF